MNRNAARAAENGNSCQFTTQQEQFLKERKMHTKQMVDRTLLSHCVGILGVTQHSSLHYSFNREKVEPKRSKNGP
ncbi:Hypothetical predicted protein [Octopus vulgaris]|uniref:Uncharacterized protein n=1 Tax=Octopus vulgaris TaxID=6645 RepID=A0AA36AQY1_OCTVU|nr:Hypothetical predicted protein [Octopus vulgaris]